MTLDSRPDAHIDEPTGLHAVEQAVAGHPRLAEAAATIHVDHFGNEWLVVCAEPAVGAVAPTERELRPFLAGRLPEAAQPDTVLVLGHLPRDADGEVDRAALPGPPADAVPRSVHAALLRDMFAAVLGRASVRPGDNFFDIGGHSLLVTRLVSRIRGVMDVNVGVREIFDAPTIGAVIDDIARPGGPLPAVRRRPAPATPLLNPRQAAMRAARDEGESHPQTVQISARLTGPLEQETLRAALTDVVTRHEALRTVEAASGGGPQLLSPGLADLDVLTVLETTGEEAPHLIEQERDQPFEASGPPVRATLLVLGRQRHVLVFTADRIACDRRSAEIVLRDLLLAYAARRAGRAPVWRLPVQASDHAAWLSEVFGSADDPDSAAAAQLSWWREYLDGPPPALAPPPEPRRPGGVVALTVPADVHAGLRVASRKQKATLAMAVQAAVAVALDDPTGEVRLALPVTGRTDPALDDTVGYLDNDLVLRIDLTGDPGFDELIGRVRATALLVDHQPEAPVERVLAETVRTVAAAVELLDDPTDLPAVPELAVDVEPARTGRDGVLDVVLRETFDTGGEPAGLYGELRHPTGQDGTAVTAILSAVLAAAAADPAVPIGTLRAGTQPPEASSDTVDRVLAAWADVLGMPATAISIDDDRFLPLGGSVQLLTLISRLQDELGVLMPIEELVNGDITVRSMTRLIDRLRAGNVSGF